MEDPNLILTLTAIDGYAEESLQLPHNRKRCPPGKGDGSSSRDPTPGPEQEDHSSELMLRFDHRPKNIAKGFVFGTDPLHCDVRLRSTIGKGKNKQRNKIGGQHFQITFDNKKRLILKDTSHWGTAVSYNGQAREEARNEPFTWILFPDGWKIQVHVLENAFIFELKLATHKGCQAEYEANLRSYTADRQTALPPIENIGFGGYKSTARPSQSLTPKKGPIYVFGRQLGKGAFGKVHYAINVSKGQEYAGKTFNPGTRFEVEVEILKAISHEHIVEFVDFQDTPTPLLILEYLPLGDLQAQHRSSQIMVEEIIILFHQMLRALAYIHTCGYAHRDIKPTNILIESRTPRFRAKLADFGLAKDRSALASCVGSYCYTAPEIWTRTAYTEAVDIWSLGVVIFEFAYGLPENPGRFKPMQWYPKLIEAVQDWESDDLIDLLSTKVLREHSQNRLSANDLSTEVSKLNFGTLNLTPRQLSRGPSELSTQLWNPAADRGREPELEGWQRSTGRPRGSDESSYGRRSKRPCIGRVDDVSTKDLNNRPTQLHHSERSGTPELETQSSSQHPQVDEYLRLSFGKDFVTIRTRDFRVNGTQILKAAGRGRQGLTQLRQSDIPFDIVRGNPHHQGTYVNFNVGLKLCQQCGLDELESLLRKFHTQYGYYTSSTAELPSIQPTSSDQYLKIDDGNNHSILVRTADNAINITQILKAAGYNRFKWTKILGQIKPWCEKFDSVMGGPHRFKGTYIDMPAALRTCEELGLDDVRRLVEQHEHRQGGSTAHIMVVQSPKEPEFEPTVSLNSSPTRSGRWVRQSTGIHFNPPPEADTTARNSVVLESQYSMRGQPFIAASADADSDPSDADSDLNDADSDPNDGDTDRNDGVTDRNDGVTDPEDIHAIELSTPLAISPESSYSNGSFLSLTRGSILQQPVHPCLQIESGAEHAVELPTSPANFTEPSYSKGSFLPPTGGSFLQQSAHPSLRPVSNQSSYRLESITGWYPGEHSVTGYDFD